MWVRSVPSAGVGVSLGTAPSPVCAHTVARPRPQAHPVTLLISTLTAPQAVPKLYQAHGPLAAPYHSPQGTNAALPAPAPCPFSARTPPPKKSPPRLRPGSLDSEVTLLLRRGCPHSQAIGRGLAQPGFPSEARGPSLLLDA